MRSLATWLCAASMALCAAVPAAEPAGAPASAPAQQQKVLRYAFLIAETGFDPAQITDLYSRTITPHIFEALYQYDYLARPFKVQPLTAAALPEVSSDFKTWTVRLKSGIYFADDEVFKGRKRELVAADYVYSIKRFFDPAVKSPSYSGYKDAGILGLEELRQDALKNKKPFDYDREIEGVRALDRYTIQFKLAQPRPRFWDLLTASDIYGAVAREVVEHYGEQIMAHPVGTGPFRLAQWRRSSFIALERNPNFREVYYDAEPAADDAQGRALLARFKGRRLPLVDRVEISIIEESQPRWLAFLQGQQDLMDRLPNDFAPQVLPGGKLAPNLTKKHLTLHRVVASDVALSYFNMEDPVVGGYTPEKVALRRAIGLAIDVDREIRLFRRGQSVPAQSLYVPNTIGYDPEFRSDNSEHDVARANALLDMYGYVDRDGDGWREQPDGSPLVIEYATHPDQLSRQMDELWKHNLATIGIRMTFKVAKWPETMKAARAGKVQMWFLGSSADSPDGGVALQRVYSPAAGGQNLARFKLPEMDRLYERSLELPDGPERAQVLERARNLVLAYAPYHYHVHRIYNDITQPWLIGYRRPPFASAFWQYLDIDNDILSREAP